MCSFCNLEINFVQFSIKCLQPLYTIPKYHKTVIPSVGTCSCDYDISYNYNLYKEALFKCTHKEIAKLFQAIYEYEIS